MATHHLRSLKIDHQCEKGSKKIEFPWGRPTNRKRCSTSCSVFLTDFVFINNSRGNLFCCKVFCEHFSQGLGNPWRLYRKLFIKLYFTKLSSLNSPYCKSYAYILSETLCTRNKIPLLKLSLQNDGRAGEAGREQKP